MTAAEAPDAALQDDSIDPAVFAELRDLGDDFLVALVTQFIGETEAHLADLRGAIAEADDAATARIAHCMKGGSGQLGGSRLHGLCNRLEQRAILGDLSRGELDLRSLELEFALMRDSLTRRLPAAA